MLRDRDSRIWAILMAATLASWTTGHEIAGRGGTVAIVFALAFGKVWLVGREFMDLRHAPWPAQAVLAVWAIGMAATLTGYFVAAG